MRTNITKEDVLKLREEFNEYADRAEQHKFPLLALMNIKIDKTIEHFSETSIKDLNAMFRVIYGVIGKDKTDYLEEQK